MSLKRRFLKTALATLLTIAVNLVLATSEAHASEQESLTKTQTFMESEGEANVKWPEVISNEKGVWKLAEISQATIDPGWTRPSELKSVTKSVTVNAAQAQSANTFFENAINYNESGWAGLLTKAGVDLSPEYEICKRQVDKLITLTGLPSNDVTQIPQTKEFEVSTAETLNSTGLATLALSDVAWIVTKTNERGIPLEYSASCNYRGIEEYLTIPAYTLTCTWTGEVQQIDTQMISTAIYELETPFPWLAIAVITAATACVIIGIRLCARTPSRIEAPQEA